MSLFLTSDEKTLKSNNSRVKFSNEISQDFFQDYPFNLSLKDVYFDPKFPTLTSDNAPHVITIIKGEHHTLDEFPQRFKDLVAFKSLFHKKFGQSVSAPLIVHKDIICNDNISEIHPSIFLLVSQGCIPIESPWRDCFRRTCFLTIFSATATACFPR